MRALVLLVILGNTLMLKCQEDDGFSDDDNNMPEEPANPSYSFSYGVSDVHTGDVKTVWEAKKGDTVKGHYSVLEPDGSMRTVEYSAGPDSGFQAVVNTEGPQNQVQEISRSNIEEKSSRDYGKYKEFDIPEDFDLEASPSERKRSKHPFDTIFSDYSSKKHPKFPHDLESSEYTHSINIKHPYDESPSGSDAHSHIGFSGNFDPFCKTKKKKENYDNMYTNVADFDFKKQKYPTFTSESFKENYDKYGDDLSNYEMDKIINSYRGQYKHKDEVSRPTANKYKYSLPDVPSADKYYPEDSSRLRPKKKYKPQKNPEPHFPIEDLDDYVLVPKKKRKPPIRIPETSDYLPDVEEDYDRPQYPFNDDDDDRYHSPPRGSSPKEVKEVVRKVIKKRKPVINLLDIFDI